MKYVQVGETEDPVMGTVVEMVPDTWTRRSVGGYYIRRAPVVWMEAAVKISRRAALVAVWLANLRGSQRSQALRLTPTFCRNRGMGRATRTRALRDLERAGLIEIRREKNHTLIELKGWDAKSGLLRK